MDLLSITPIGTCRIKSPLSRAQGRYPVDMRFEAVYGLVHSAFEALQMVRYLQGEKTFDPRSYPTLLNPGVLPESIGNADRTPSDLYLIEISSAKKITSLGDAHQINYLYRAIPELFSQKTLVSRFWSLARQDERAPLHEFLDSLPVFREMSDDNKALLRDMRMEIESEEEIAAQMVEMVERLGRDKILFVTHVNAITAESRIIADRDRLITTVKKVAGQLGADCYDPTDAMFSVGQEIALARGGTDLSHYTAAFADLVFFELFRKYIGPRFGLAGAIDEQAISAQIDEEIVAGRIGSLIDKDPALAAAELDAALRKMPEASSLAEMKGRLLFAAGKNEEARPILAALAARDALSSDGLRDLLDLAVASRDWDTALPLVERLLADEIDSHRAFVLGAATFEALGDKARAADSLQRAYLADRQDLASGLRALELLLELGEPFRAAAMRRQIIENNTGSTQEIAILRDWALANRDAKLLSAAHSKEAPDDFGKTLEVTRQLVEFRDHDASAAALVQLCDLAAGDAGHGAVVAQLAEQMEAWARKEAAAQNAGPAYVLAKAVAEVRGERLLPEIGDLVEAFREEIGNDIERQAYAELADKGADARTMIMDDEEMSWRYAFAVHKAGHDADALSMLSQCRVRYPENMIALRLHGRIAAIAGRYDLAVPSFTLLRDSGSDVAEQYAWEIERFFGKLDHRGTKALREAIDTRDLAQAMDTYRVLAGALDEMGRLESMRLRLVRALVLEVRRLETARGFEAEMEENLRRIIEIDPGNVRAIRRLARLLMDNERFGESRDLWLEAMERDPSNVSDMRNVRQCTAMISENEGEPVSA